MSPNIAILKRVAGLKNFHTLCPFLIAYGLFYGLSLFNIFFLQSLFAIAVIVLEVPAGVLSDCYGRKRCVCYGAVMAIVSASLFLLWTSFFGFILAELAYAMAFVLFSGSDTALLFESSDRQQYSHHESRVQAYSRSSEGLSGFIGGLAYSLSIVLLPILELIAAIILLYQTLSLKEVRSSYPAHWRGSQLRLAWLEQLRSLKQHFMNPDNGFIRLVILFSAFVSTITLSMFWLLQVWFAQHHLAPYWMGCVWLVYHSCSAFASLWVKPCMARLSIDKLFIGLFLGCTCVVIIGGVVSSQGVLILFLLSALLFGFKMPFIFCVINQSVSHDIRAGLLSLDSCVSRALFAVISLVVGYVVQAFSFQAAFYVLAGFQVVSFFILLPLIKYKQVASV
ncbi:MAG: hypothetical protein CMF55_07120 [Legionellales bacterium]|nr:hypothetical protein [Legionellales bacterium]